MSPSIKNRSLVVLWNVIIMLTGIKAIIPENLYPGDYLIKIAKMIKNQYDNTLEKQDFKKYIFQNIFKIM